MIERWQRIPIRWKASGALLVVLGLLTGLWGSLGWPWPTRELAFRMAERARAFGPGEIVAQGELTYAHDWDGAPKGWMVSRSGDAFLVLDLYSMGLSPRLARAAVRQALGAPADEQWGELCFTDRAGKQLPLGTYYRFTR